MEELTLTVTVMPVSRKTWAVLLSRVDGQVLAQVLKHTCSSKQDQTITHTCSFPNGDLLLRSVV